MYAEIAKSSFLTLPIMTEQQVDSNTTLRELFVFLVNDGRIKSTGMYEKAIASLQKSAKKEFRIDELNETILDTWIDELSQKLSRETAIRYIESIGKLYKIALRLDIVTNDGLFENVQNYMSVSFDGPGAKKSTDYVEAIRKLARVKRTENNELSVAIDVYLFSFFNAAIDIEDCISLRFDSDGNTPMPQTEAIKERYVAPIRKYVFPLAQRQKTGNKIKENLAENVRKALQLYRIDISDNSLNGFITEAWIATAKSCGVQLPEILACCRSAADNPRFKDIVPADLSVRQIDNIKKTVANRIIDLKRYWYAIRFFGKEEDISREIHEICDGAPIKIYYPVEEICRKVGKRRIIKNRPTIRNILFLRAMPRCVNTIARKKFPDSKYFIFRNRSSEDNSFAIIPDDQMHRFSELVSNGLDILGDEELKNAKFEKGSYVHIDEGQYKGYSGRVVKIISRDNSQNTLLEINVDKFGPAMEDIFGKHLYVKISSEIVSKFKAI